MPSRSPCSADFFAHSKRSLSLDSPFREGVSTTTTATKSKEQTREKSLRKRVTEQQNH
jgi:hypothetical protein